jgi:hypothetical protein
VANSSSSGPGLVVLLTVLFVGLKLTGYITWSWLWVLSPLWITFIIFILVICGIIGFIAKYGK